MATIPRIVASKGLDAGNVVQYPGGSPVGEALEKAGRTGTNLVAAAQDRLLRAESFDATLSFNTFRERTASDLLAAQQTIQPGATGFTDNFLGQFDQKAKEWIGTLPANTRPEFQMRLDAQRESIAREAAKVEFRERQAHEVQGIAGRTEAAQTTLMRTGPDGLPMVEQDLNDLIDRSALTPVQREEAKRGVRSKLQETGFRALPPEDQIRVAKGWGIGNVFSGNATDRAMQLLRDKEGFKSSTYWDVNADRVGYGSDTITDAQGNVRPVRRGDTVTRDDAERDLRRRTQETFTGIQSRVGAEAFGRLNANQQASLASVAYNYGSLPDSVAAAVQGGDAETIARSIEGLQGHNNGVNRNRRLAEAALARSSGDGPVSEVYDADARFDAVPPDRRFILAGAAETEMRKQTARQAELATQTYNDQFNALQTNIIDGKANLADVEKARQDGWLRDAGDIRTVMGQITARDKGMADTSNFSKAFSDPDFQWNPVDGNHKDWADAGFRSLGGTVQALEAVASKSGIVPAAAGSVLRGALYSGDQTRARDALTVAGNLMVGKYPNILSTIEGGKEVADAALAFRHFSIDLGMGPDVAARKVLEQRTPEYQRTIAAKVKSTDVDTIVRKNLKEDDIQDAFDDWWPGAPKLGFNPKMRQRAMGDYEELFREKYAVNDNIALSKTQALKDLHNVWGVTAVNGSQVIMKFPPEKSSVYTGISDVGRRVADQAVASIKDWNGTVVDRSKIQILEDPRHTGDRFMRGIPPAYTLMYIDQNGVYQMIPKPFIADPKMMREQVTAERGAKFKVAFESNMARHAAGQSGIDIDRAPMGVREIIAPISSVASGLPVRGER